MRLIILGAAFFVGVFGRQNGPDMCTLYPGKYDRHESGYWHGTKQRSSSYKLTITSPKNTNCFSPDTSYSVKLEGRTARDDFHGFLCQARKYGKLIDEVVDVGSFEKFPKGSVQQVEYLNCIAHTHERSKRRITAVWKAPGSTEAGRIELICTVVKVERGPVYGYVWNRKRDSVKIWELKPKLLLSPCSSSRSSARSSPRSSTRSSSPRSRSSSSSCRRKRDQRSTRDCSTWKRQGICSRGNIKRLCARTCCDSAPRPATRAPRPATRAPRPSSRPAARSSCSRSRDKRDKPTCGFWKAQGFCSRSTVKDLCAKTCCK